MKLAFFGGSFNPVHFGHLRVAETVAAQFDYDLVLLVPAYISPFKGESDGASPKDRLDLLKLAVAGRRRLAVEDCEINRAGISFTIDTIEGLEKRYRPSEKIGLVIGEDLLGEFPRWRRVAELVQRTDLIVARRLTGSELSPVRLDCQLTLEIDGQVRQVSYQLVNNPILSLSSGEIRRRIAADRNWRHLVPLGARRLIVERRLYGLPSPDERDRMDKKGTA